VREGEKGRNSIAVNKEEECKLRRERNRRKERKKRKKEENMLI